MENYEFLEIALEIKDDSLVVKLLDGSPKWITSQTLSSDSIPLEHIERHLQNLRKDENG